jgi:hypothetical protein
VTARRARTPAAVRRRTTGLAHAVRGHATRRRAAREARATSPRAPGTDGSSGTDEMPEMPGRVRMATAMGTLAKVVAMVAVATGVGPPLTRRSVSHDRPSHQRPSHSRPVPAAPVAATPQAAMAARRKRSTMPRPSCPAGLPVVLGPTTRAAGRGRPRRATGAGKA